MGAPKFYPDGLYSLSEIRDALSSDFRNEQELCDFIEIHIFKFTKDILGFDMLSYKREFPLHDVARNRSKGSKRIDFYIKTVCGKSFGIECKKPKFKCELTQAVGQCLSYFESFNRIDIPIDQIYLVSSIADIDTIQVINKFKLPITFIAMDKLKFIKLT